MTNTKNTYLLVTAIPRYTSFLKRGRSSLFNSFDDSTTDCFGSGLAMTKTVRKQALYKRFFVLRCEIIERPINSVLQLVFT
jgi:hypothetical protein